MYQKHNIPIHSYSYWNHSKDNVHLQWEIPGTNTPHTMVWCWSFHPNRKATIRGVCVCVCVCVSVCGATTRSRSIHRELLKHPDLKIAKWAFAVLNQNTFGSKPEVCHNLRVNCFRNVSQRLNCTTLMALTCQNESLWGKINKSLLLKFSPTTATWVIAHETVQSARPNTSAGDSADGGTAHVSQILRNNNK